MSSRLATVLIVSDHDGHARVDRAMAKSLGAREVVWLTSGALALAHLADHDAELVLVDAGLADMSGLDLARQLTPRATVLLTATDGSQEAVLDALAAGCSGYLLRPYSQDTLARQARQARRVARAGGADLLRHKVRHLRAAAPAAPRPQPRNTGPTGRHDLDRGRFALAAGRYDEAIDAFTRVGEISRLAAVASEGLAAAWAGKGELARAAQWLERAAKDHAEADRFLEAKALYGRLRKLGRPVANPFHQVAERLWSAGHLAAAIQAWRRAVLLTPEDEAVVVALARGLAYLGQRSAAVHVLDAALARTPELPAVAHYRLELLPRPAPQRPSLLAWLRTVFGILRRGLEPAARSAA